MTRNCRLALFLFGALSLLPACAALTLEYTVEPMEARIVDAETKQPIEGAIVVAHWQLEQGTPGGNIQAGQLAVMESVTDKDGKFSFPGFGPKTVWNRILVNEDPRLLIFKSGYEYLSLANPYNSTPELRTNPVRRSVWNARTIELKPFRGTVEEYAEHVHRLDNELEWARYGEGCVWKKVPRMLVTLHGLSEEYDARGIKLRGWRGGVRVRNVDDVGNQSRCGSGREFFRSYLP